MDKPKELAAASRRIREEEQTVSLNDSVTLWGIAVKGPMAGTWSLQSTLFQSRAEAVQEVKDTWSGTGCECRIFSLPGRED